MPLIAPTAIWAKVLAGLYIRLGFPKVLGADKDRPVCFRRYKTPPVPSNPHCVRRSRSVRVAFKYPDLPITSLPGELLGPESSYLGTGVHM